MINEHSAGSPKGNLVVASYCEKKQMGLCGSCDTYCMDREIMTEEAIHRQFREEEGWRRWVYLMASALT